MNLKLLFVALFGGKKAKSSQFKANNAHEIGYKNKMSNLSFGNTMYFRCKQKKYIFVSLKKGGSR